MTAVSTGKGSTGIGAAARGGSKPAKLEVCHPSVCVGNVKPSNCVCPTPEK